MQPFYETEWLKIDAKEALRNCSRSFKQEHQERQVNEL